ncbi:unnamed protein product [Dovyalis caffra]|uniref:Trichome birefringence-like N-terminal domain-containing protein n=1 Tax=Dovyalis caffra TaxID=77055 RepID=A0AAV1SJ75_9ROSI|nr:unnamed protein product [Dovyalis caffra]
MKSRFAIFRSTAFSLLLIVLVCATVIIWAWNRTPLLTAFLPPNGLLQLSPEANDKHPALKVGRNGTAETSTGLVEAEVKHDQKMEKILKKDVQIMEFAAPVRSENSSSRSENASSTVKEQHIENVTRLMDDQGCNYAKGKWVLDNNRSLYSGFHCKQWLSQMWACRLMQRKDFAYEKIRWQPKNCQMEAFEGSKFLERMRNKTLAFVGDSLGRQQFQSLMCMITGGRESPEVMDVGKEYGLVVPKGGARPNGWAYRFASTNTTVLYYWSSCLCDLESINITNPATDFAMHLDRPPGFLRQFLHKLDVLVLNTGHHWNRGKLKANRWVMYVGGMPNTNRRLAMIGNAKNFTIHRKEVVQDESSDYSAGNAVKGTGVKLLDITALSQLRDEGHISQYSITAVKGVHDCLHWCLPGVPDTWNEILFARLSATSVNNS